LAISTACGTQALRRAGFHYVMVTVGEGGYAEVGRSLESDPAGWGMEPAGYAGRARLFQPGQTSVIAGRMNMAYRPDSQDLSSGARGSASCCCMV